MKYSTSYLIIVILWVFIGCDKTDETDTKTDLARITIGAFTLNNGIYTDTGNSIILESEGDCQTWSRTALGDSHSSSSHLHYNAATDIIYNSADTVLTYTEYGPELDQSSIESTCSAGLNGKTKTVDSRAYYQDKPNVYLKITKVE